MVYLYAANIGSLPDPKEHPEMLEGLWKERKEKALRMKLESGRKQCAGAGLLLKAVSENEYLYGFEGDVRTSEFFRIWTMKESYLKMTGEGISFPLNRIEFKLGEPIGVYRDGEKCDCHVREYEIPGYKVSVCTKETEFAEKMEMIEIMD